MPEITSGLDGNGYVPLDVSMMIFGSKTPSLCVRIGVNVL